MGVRSLHISDFNEQNNRLQCRSFCKQLKHKTRAIHQLAPRPRSNRSQCHVTSMEGKKGLWISPILLNILVSSKSTEREINYPSSNASMASPALLCNNTETLHSESNSPPNISSSSVMDKGDPHPLVMNNSLQLVGWVVSGDPFKQCNYQKS